MASVTPTHAAYVLALDGTSPRWLEIGSAWDAEGGFQMQLDRLPVDLDKFTGIIRLSPIGTEPPPPDPEEIRSLARPVRVHRS